MLARKPTREVQLSEADPTELGRTGSGPPETEIGNKSLNHNPNKSPERTFSGAGRMQPPSRPPIVIKGLYTVACARGVALMLGWGVANVRGSMCANCAHHTAKA